MEQSDILELEVRKIIEEDLADAATITPSMVADLAGKELREHGLEFPIAVLTNMASTVLKEIFEPNVGAGTALRHAAQLEKWWRENRSRN